MTTANIYPRAWNHDALTHEQLESVVRGYALSRPTAQGICDRRVAVASMREEKHEREVRLCSGRAACLAGLRTGPVAYGWRGRRRNAPMMAPASSQDHARTPESAETSRKITVDNVDGVWCETESQRRRTILGALHTLTGTMEPWREVGLVMRRYLGPWVGMSATERWETLGAVELALLADAVTERAAIVSAQSDADRPREVVICGGRDYQPNESDRRWVIYWLGWLSARGVDRWAGTLAARLGLDTVCMPADWDAHGKAAGPMRNVAMAERFPVAVLALPGGRGTADMCRVAADLRVPVIERNDPNARAA